MAECPPCQPLLDNECWSEDYESARAKFRDAAAAAGAELTTLLVVEPDYTMDIAVVRGSGRGLAIHSSGTHGVEGYAGSAIQIAALRSLRTQLEPTVLFVHSINPFGMAHFRRWNEHNVDLNRNAMDAKEWEGIRARDPNIAGYEDFRSLLCFPNEPGMLYTFVGIWLHALYLLLSHGVLKLKTAMVTGTYTRPEGVFYGGSETEKSTELLRGFLKRFTHIPGTEVTWIDVHTGLGPQGEDVLLCSEERKEEVLRCFPGAGSVQTHGAPSENRNFTDASQGAGYELSCGFLAPHLGRCFSPPAFNVTQEFGTHSNLKVGVALILENAGYQHACGCAIQSCREAQEKHAYWRTFTRDAFYVRTGAWKESVLARGLSMFDQLVARAAATGSTS